jgi:hypothetical protein
MFIVAKKWKQPNYLSTNRWETLCSIHTTDIIQLWKG